MSTASAQTPSPPPVPIGPSAERWRAMSEDERETFYEEMFAILHDPLEGMGEGRTHRRISMDAFDALTRYFEASRRRVYVADQLTVIYPDEPVFEPDLLAVLDVAQPAGHDDERMAWVVVDEGKGLDFVLEVLHHGNRKKDLVTNVARYARLGIREYFVYDRRKYKLYGYRQPGPGAPYRELRPRLGLISSEVLGLDLALVDHRLRFFSSGTAELLTSADFIEKLSKMMDSVEARAQEAEAQAQQAEAQARQQSEQTLLEARQAVLDLAEAYGLDVSAERRQQVESASLQEVHALRLALKATRAWP